MKTVIHQLHLRQKIARRLSAMAICSICCFLVAIPTSIAQPPVLTSLQLHLDAGSGFNPGSPAVWHDISGQGNHLSSGGGGTEPIHHVMAPGTNFSSLEFDGIDDYMGSGSPAVGWAQGNGITETTLFVVRMANTGNNMISHSVGSTYRNLISIAGDHNADEEFGLISDWAHHHNTIGQFYYKDHQCYPSLPDDRPVVLSGVYLAGTTTSDLDYYVNNVVSSNLSSLPPGGAPPTPYTSIDRVITIGARYDNSSVLNEFFQGHIFEVLAYNRALSSSEVNQVNEWLMCKYDIDYPSSMCNTTSPPVCSQDCFESPQLDVVFTGLDGNGDCMFTATAMANTGYTITHYEWQYPGTGSSWVADVTSANTSSKSFTLTGGIAGNVRVKMYAYNTSSVGGGSFCCELQLDKSVYCSMTLGPATTGHSD